MVLSAGQYSMQCWQSTHNPEQLNRPRILSQCFKLIKVLQRRFTNNEIAVPSTDTESSTKGIEICILSRAGSSPFADITNFLTEAASSLGLEYRNFVKQEASTTTHFSQAAVDNLAILARPVPDGLDEQLIIEYNKRARQFKEFSMNDTWKDNTSAEHRFPPFLITHPTLQRLRSKEGSALIQEIRSILTALLNAKYAKKTGYAFINMVALGTVAIADVGFVGGSLAGSIHSALILWTLRRRLAALFAASVLTVIDNILIDVLPAMKSAINVLIIANDTTNDIMPHTEYIQNGERVMVPEMIPAAIVEGDFISCGLFVYTKHLVLGMPLSLYGSAYGVSLESGNANLSIGMDCPNTVLGGNNSIEVLDQAHAQKACQMALDSGRMHGQCHRPNVDVKIGSHYGDVNWGRAIIMKD